MPDPTYKQLEIAGVERYVCLVPDAGQPGGICGWYSRPIDDEEATELLRQHMLNAHAGVMVAEEPDAVEDDIPEPAVPAGAGSAPTQVAQAPPVAPDQPPADAA